MIIIRFGNWNNIISEMGFWKSIGLLMCTFVTIFHLKIILKDCEVTILHNNFNYKPHVNNLNSRFQI